MNVLVCIRFEDFYECALNSLRVEIEEIRCEVPFAIYEVSNIFDYFNKSYTNTIELAKVLCKKEEVCLEAWKSTYLTKSAYEEKENRGQIFWISCFWNKNGSKIRKNIAGKESVSKIMIIVRKFLKRRLVTEKTEKYNQNNICHLRESKGYTYFDFSRLRLHNSFSEICA